MSRRRRPRSGSESRSTRPLGSRSARLGKGGPHAIGRARPPPPHPPSTPFALQPRRTRGMHSADTSTYACVFYFDPNASKTLPTLAIHFTSSHIATPNLGNKSGGDNGLRKQRRQQCNRAKSPVCYQAVQFPHSVSRPLDRRHSRGIARVLPLLTMPNPPYYTVYTTKVLLP